MKNYTITVNGNVYDVTVEETGSTSGAATPRRTAAKPAAAPAAPAASAGAGNIFKIEKKVGDAVKKGDTVLVLEIMKMETPVVAPEDGTVASIDVAVGDAVESGALLATLN